MRAMLGLEAWLIYPSLFVLELWHGILQSLVYLILLKRLPNLEPLLHSKVFPMLRLRTWRHFAISRLSDLIETASELGTLAHVTVFPMVTFL
jgi:hypothetical protein